MAPVNRWIFLDLDSGRNGVHEFPPISFSAQICSHAIKTLNHRVGSSRNGVDLV